MGWAAEGEASRELALKVKLPGLGERKDVDPGGDGQHDAAEEPKRSQHLRPDGCEQTEGGPGEREAEELRGGAHRKIPDIGVEGLEGCKRG